MTKDGKFALLVIGLPFLGLFYCAFIIAFIIYSPVAREHPIITATIFVLAPSLISGSAWLRSSLKAKDTEHLGI